MEGDSHPAYAGVFVGRRTSVSDSRLESVYRTHAAMLHRRCLQILGDEQEALDALQDLFLQLRDKLDTFRGEANLTTWLYRVATNHCLNRLRSARAKLSLERSRPAENHHDPRPLLERRDLISKLFAELDDDEVQIAFHRHHDGMTQQEIAEVLGVTERTVRNRLDRLDAKLKAHLALIEETSK